MERNPKKARNKQKNRNQERPGIRPTLPFIPSPKSLKTGAHFQSHPLGQIPFFGTRHFPRGVRMLEGIQGQRFGRGLLRKRWDPAFSKHRPSSFSRRFRTSLYYQFNVFTPFHPCFIPIPRKTACSFPVRNGPDPEWEVIRRAGNPDRYRRSIRRNRCPGDRNR